VAAKGRRARLGSEKTAEKKGGVRDPKKRKGPQFPAVCRGKKTIRPHRGGNEKNQRGHPVPNKKGLVSCEPGRKREDPGVTLKTGGKGGKPPAQ